MSQLTYVDQPVPLDLPKIVQGQDWQWSFLLENPDGTAVDTTGMTFTCQMRESRTTNTVVFTPSIVVAENQITLKISHSLTTAVKQSKLLRYDIFQADSLGAVLPLFEGAVPFEQAITRG